MIVSLIVYVICLIVIQNVASNDILVEVKQGSLRGEQRDLVTKDGRYYSFKGIPYAAPPIGKLRFKAPQPPYNWQGIRNATEHGAVCPQIEILSKVYIPGDEDCLFLNVYSPNLKPCTLLPVIVFIHGGGYQSGSGNDDSFGPDFLIRKDLIVVTLNYRLGPLGFLNLGSEDVPGNAGLKDQVLALKWVQENIVQFGGDPDKVTIMGQSAGSAAVVLHTISPMSAGLFQRAIALSGTPNCDWSLSMQSVRRSFKLGKSLGFRTRDPKKLLDYLQTVPKDKLLNTVSNVFAFEELANIILHMYPYVPVKETYYGENTFMTAELFNHFTHINKADILFGYTNQESVTALDIIINIMNIYDRFPEIFVPRNITYSFPLDTITELGDKIVNYYFGDKNIDENSIKEFVRYANAMYSYNIPKYMSKYPKILGTSRYFYRFSSVSSRNVLTEKFASYNITGAGHSEDLFYLFDPKQLNMSLSIESEEFRLIDEITTLFSNFVKFGNPTPESTFSVTWPLFDSNNMYYLDIGNNLSVKRATDDDNMRFWDSIYKSVGINN